MYTHHSDTQWPSSTTINTNFFFKTKVVTSLSMLLPATSTLIGMVNINNMHTYMYNIHSHTNTMYTLASYPGAQGEERERLIHTRLITRSAAREMGYPDLKPEQFKSLRSN